MWHVGMSLQSLGLLLACCWLAKKEAELAVLSGQMWRRSFHQNASLFVL
jgi:hypothetical protein